MRNGNLFLTMQKQQDMELVERFLDYVGYDTQSSETAGTTPSTPKQTVFAEHLKEQLEDLDFDDVCLDEHGYIYATLPANSDKRIPTIGFISHYDTSPDCSGANVKPRIVENMRQIRNCHGIYRHPFIPSLNTAYA